MPPEHVAADDHAPTRDLPLAALWRTRSYLRPYLGRLIFMLAAACASVGAEIVIPLLTKSIIDGAITRGDRELPAAGASRGRAGRRRGGAQPAPAVGPGPRSHRH